MPKIPQYVAQQGIKTGPVADQINVGAMTAPAAAIGTFAGAAQDVGAFFQSREKERGLRWAGDAQYKFTNAMTEWHMANQDREDYGPAFKEYAEKVSSDFVSAAPNKQAGQALQQQLQRSISQQYEVALRAGEKTRLENFDLAEFNSTQSYMELYRQMQAKDPIGASAIVEGHTVGQIARINAAMADKAPAFALKMRARAIETVIEGVMDTDPDLAEMLLMESKDIPEQLRQAKLDKINNTRKQLRVLDVNAFNMSIENDMSNAEMKGTYVTVPSENTFVAVYQDEASGKLAYQKHRLNADVHNGALDLIKDEQGKSSYAMQRSLDARKAKGGGVVEQKAIERADQMVKAMARFADSNPVEYVQSYNPVVSRARELYDGATDKTKAGLFRQLNAETLRYQGHAPAGAPDAEYYLGLDSHQVSLLSKGQAEKFAGQINNGTPTEKVDAIKSFDAMFEGDPDAKAIAFRDLTQLGPGKAITQQAQTLSMHAYKPYARQLAQSMSPGVAQENAKNKGLDLKDYEKTLVTNPQWKAFSAMYGGDNKQRAHLVAGFREAIVAYATSLDISSADQATKASIDTLIGSEFRFEDIGKQTVPFAKWAGPDGRAHGEDKSSFMGVGYGESEMDAVVSRVKTEFSNTILAADIMQTTDEGALLWPNSPNATQQAIDTYVQNDLNENKMLVPAEDGKGMYVYMTTTLGIPVQLRTRDKRPLYISFDSTSKRHNLPTVQAKGRAVERSPLLEFKPLGFDIPEPVKIDRVKRPSGYLPE